MNTVKSADLVDIISVGNTLGEGVLWDPVGQRVWWTDIQERRLFSHDPLQRALQSFELPERLGSFGFVAGSDEIVAAFESGFAIYDPETRRLGELAGIDHDAPAVQEVVEVLKAEPAAGGNFEGDDHRRLGDRPR